MGFVGAILESVEEASEAQRRLLVGLGPGARLVHRQLENHSLVVAAGPGVELAEAPDGSFAVMDGEIHACTSGRGTELSDVLDAVRQDGVGALQHFDATFGLTVFDMESGDVTAARDVVGNGSLFSTAGRGARVVWSSRLRHLQAAVGATRPDWSAIDFFLSNGFIPSPWTGYEGLERLGPGEGLTITTGVSGPSHVRVRYHEFTPLGPADATDGTGILRDELLPAVARRVGDIATTGVLLSGGVDSQLIATLIAREFGPPKTFTFEYLDYSGPINEGDRAQACADFLGAEHVLIPVEGQRLVEGLPNLLLETAEPMARTIHTVVLDQVVEAGVDALLTGDGGDSLYLNGGDRKALALSNVPAWFRRSFGLIPDSVSPRSGTDSRLPRRVRRFADGFKRAAARAELGLNVSLEAEFLPLAFRASMYTDPNVAVAGHRALLGLVSSERERLGELAEPDRIRVLEFRFDSADDLLRRNLDIAQANGVRIRAPIFSKDLMERWIRNPVSTRASLRQTSDEFTKPEIRQLAGEVLPTELANAPKRGHSIPIHLWLRGQLRPWISDRVSRHELERHDVFDPDAVQALLNAHLEHRGEFGWALWSIAVVGEWLDQLAVSPRGWLEGLGRGQS